MRQNVSERDIERASLPIQKKENNSKQHRIFFLQKQQSTDDDEQQYPAQYTNGCVSKSSVGSDDFFLFTMATKQKMYNKSGTKLK